MKRRLLTLFIILIVSLLAFCACDKFFVSADPNEYTVTYETNGGSAVASAKVARGGLAIRPEDPTKAIDDFEGWFADEELTTPWNFETDKVVADTTLYAKWSHNCTGGTATCTKFAICTGCGESYGSLDRNNHTVARDGKVNPTCYSTGLTEGAHCDACGEILKAQEEVAKLPHTPVTVPAVAPTCEKTGLTAGTKCSVCDEVIVAQEVVPVVAHTYDNEQDTHCNVCNFERDVACLHTNTTTIPGYAATCTEPGLTDGQKCTNEKCGHIVVAQQTINPLGHAWGDWNETLAPTYDTEGEERRDCTRAGCDEYETRPVAKLTREVTVYLVATELWDSDNARFAVYMWNDGGNHWVSMVPSCEKGVYTAVVPAGYTNVIFVRMAPNSSNDWANKWNQTNDLTVAYGGDNCYTIETTGSAEVKATGAWTVYTLGDHEYDDGVVTLEPTCSTVGEKTLTCNCGHTTTAEVPVDADAHKWNAGTVTTNPTCEEVGVRTLVCEHNAAHTKNVDEPALGHTDEEDSNNLCDRCGESLCENHDWTAATCTEPETCSACGTKRGNALGHNWSDATCKVLSTCGRCHETRGELADHTWGDWTVTTAPTYVAAGEKTRECSVCHDKETDTVAVLERKEEMTVYLVPNANWNVDNARFAVYMFGANGDAWVSMTKTCDGKVYTAVIPVGYDNIIFCRMNPNNSENAWGDDKGSHKWNQTSDLVLPSDGTNLYTVAEGAWDKGAGTWSTYTSEGHKYNDGEVRLEPTCSAVGEMLYTCACGHTKTEEIPVDATKHAYDNGVVTTPATCTTDGVKTYTCAHDETHTKTEVLPQLNHLDENKDNICDRADCKKALCSDGNHKWSTPTCIAPKKCSACGAVEEVYGEHEYGEWIDAVDATYEADGTLGHYHCDVCNKDFDVDHNELESLVINKLLYTHDMYFIGTMTDNWSTETALTESWRLTESEDKTTWTGTLVVTENSEFKLYNNAEGFTGDNRYIGINDSNIVLLPGTHVVTYNVATNEITVVSELATSKIYLSTGVWNAANAWFAVYVWNATGNNWFKMTATEEKGLYVADVPVGYENAIFVRMDSGKTELSWDSKWNQTVDITLVEGKDLYTITGWGEYDEYGNQKSPVSTGNYVPHTCEFNKEVATDAYKATDATCTEKATYYYSCSCGETSEETFEYGETLAHTFNQQVVDEEYKATDASCTAKATYYYSCSCGEKGTETFENGEMLAHSYTEEVTLDPTCEDKGVKTFTCSCDDTYTEEIPANGHNYGEWNNEVHATCVATGTLGHYHCDVCGKNFNAEKQELESIEIAINPNAHHDGDDNNKCDRCDTPVCGADDHKWDDGVVTKSATCKETGTLTYTCSACNTVNEVEIPVDENAHDIKNVDAKDPTCTEIGWNAYEYCSRCDYTTYKEKNVLPHNYSEEWSVSEEKHWRECECGAKTDEAAHSDADNDTDHNCDTCGKGGITEHDYDDGTVTQKATCTVDGVKTFTCNCGHTYTETIVAEGHKGGTATCTDKAICEICGEEHGNLAEHNYEGALWMVSGNEKVRKCTACGHEDKGSLKLTTIYLVPGQWTSDGARFAAYFFGAGEKWVDMTDADNDGIYEVTIPEGGYTHIILCRMNPANASNVWDNKWNQSEDLPLSNKYDVYTFTDNWEGGKDGKSVLNGSLGEHEHVYFPATCTVKMTCYYCGTTTGEMLQHVDVDVKNHKCDVCGTATGDPHEAAEGTHNCAYCGEVASECVDENKNHACDVCEAPMGECKDENTDHKCDYGCDKVYGTCEDKNLDHDCDYGCDKVYGTCEDKDLDHDCDYGCDAVFGTCEDKDLDHDCDYGCDVVFGTCADTNKDHKCDYGCGQSYGTCEDKDLDHACDYGCKAVFGTCVDANLDHKCDYGCDKVYGEHIDAGKDHKCDYGCSEQIGTHECSVPKNNESTHWKECAYCGGKADEAAHTFSFVGYVVVDNAPYAVYTCECHYTVNRTPETTELTVNNDEALLKAALEHGYSVVLGENITISDRIYIKGYTVEINLNGHFIENNNAVDFINVNGEKSTICEVLYVTTGAKVTITGEGAMIASGNGEYIDVISAVDGGEVIIEGGRFISAGCTAVYATRGGKVTINGGYFEAEDSSFLLDINEGAATLGTIEVHGGTFVGFNPANHTNDGANTNKVEKGYHSIKDGNVYTVSAHNYGEWIEGTAATCKAEGKLSHYYCEACKTYFDANHNVLVSIVIPVDPTAHHDSDSNMNCDDCGTSLCVEHDWNEGETVVAATCTTTGTDKYTCNACGATETRTTDKLGHHLVNVEGKAATCTEDGYTAYQDCSRCDHIEGKTVLPAIKHSWTVTYTWSEGYACTATRVCANDATHTDTVTATVTDTVTTNATCEEDGLRTYTATFDVEWAETQQTTEVIAKINHDWTVTYVWANDLSTCTVTRTCKNDHSHTDTETVNATSEVTTAPTCEGEGVRTHTADFEAEWAEDQTTTSAVEAINHKNKEHHEKVDATCSATGTIEYWSCEDCDKNYSDEVCTTVVTDLVIAIDANAHDWNEGVVTTASTCSEKGIKTYTCKHNGDHTYTEDVAINPDNHSSEEFTYVNNGETHTKQYSCCEAVVETVAHVYDHACDTACDLCGATREITHNYTSEVTKAATCTEVGERTYTCNCGDTYTEEIAIDEDAHDYVGVVTTPATCSAKGETTYTCNCGDTYTEEIAIDEDAHSYGEWIVSGDKKNMVRTCAANADHTDTQSLGTLVPGMDLYLIPNANWKVDNARFAAYFFGAGETWVDMNDSNGDGIYECEVPEGNWTNVIFCRMNPSATANNWDNKWNQTSDLEIKVRHTYTVSEGAWDKGDGSWAVIPHTEHVYNVAEATCEEGKYCVLCGHVVENALGHAWGEISYEWTESNGTYTCKASRTCETCKHTENATAAVTHETTTAPTCEGTGVETYTATFAEAWATITTQTKEVEIAATGHNYGAARYEWADDHSTCTATRVCGNDETHVETATARATSVTDDATCEEDGKTTHTATFDKDWAEEQTKEVEIRATGHSYTTSVTAPTCTEAGYTTYTCACGHSYTGNTVSATGHKYGDWTITKQPTEKEVGSQYRTCTVTTCGHVETEEIARLDHVHTLTAHEANNASCTEAGNVAYWLCTCGKHFKDADATTEFEENGWVIPATGHVNLTAVGAKDPNCTEAGNKAYWLCECGVHFANEEATTEYEENGWVIPATGHTVELQNGQDATCVAAGWKAYYQCTRANCGAHFSDEAAENAIADLEAWKTGDGKIDRLATHSYGDWTSDGTDHSRSCTVTGCTATESGACSGGKAATATTRSICDTCGNEYGQYEVTLYFKANSTQWTKACIYVWKKINNKDVNYCGSYEDHTAMTEVENQTDWYMYTVKSDDKLDTFNVIFNNGSNLQTEDLTYTASANKNYWSFDNWYSSFSDGNTGTTTYNNFVTNNLFLIPNDNWKVDGARFAAYFFGNGEKWVSMTYNKELGAYTCARAAGYPSVIFCRMNPSATANNWNNKWNQTSDLTVPSNGNNCYTVKAGTWDKGGGTWSKIS